MDDSAVHKELNLIDACTVQRKIIELNDQVCICARHFYLNVERRWWLGQNLLPRRICNAEAYSIGTGIEREDDNDKKRRGSAGQRAKIDLAKDAQNAQLAVLTGQRVIAEQSELERWLHAQFLPYLSSMVTAVGFPASGEKRNARPAPRVVARKSLVPCVLNPSLPYSVVPVHYVQRKNAWIVTPLQAQTPEQIGPFHRGWESSTHPFDVGPERSQPFVDTLVAAVDQLNMLDLTFTVGDECRHNQGNAGPNVRADEFPTAQ